MEEIEMLKAMMRNFLKKHAPFLVKPDVPMLLAKGRSWTSQLNAAAAEAEGEAKVVEQQIVDMQVISTNLRSQADEGKEIAANFNEMLHARKK